MKTKLLLFALAIGVSTFGKAQHSLLQKYLPADVNTVISFNPLKLANLVPGETFRQSALYRAIMENDKGEIRAFLSDPGISGIDMSAGVLVMLKDDSASLYPGAIISIMGVLKNEALFSLMVNKISGENEAPKTYGTNKVLLTENSKPAIAWNNEIFVITNGRNAEMRQKIMGMLTDTLDRKPFDEKIKEFYADLGRLKRELCFELLTPKNNNPLLTNASFTETMNASADVRIWSNGGGITQGMLKKLPIEIAGMLTKLKPVAGKEKATLVNFENGKISSSSKAYLSGEIAKAYEQYPSAPLNPGLLQRIPAEFKVLATVAVSANPGRGKELMRQSGMAEILDSLRNKIPFDLNLVTGSFGTGGMFAVIQSDNKEMAASGEELRFGKSFTGVDFILAIPIKDKPKFDELRKAVTGFADSLKNGEKGSKLRESRMPVFKYDDKLLVMSMKERTAMAYLNNPGLTPVPGWLAELPPGPMAGMINLREIISTIIAAEPKNEAEFDKEAETINKALNILDKIVFAGGTYSNGTIRSSSEMHFGNHGENAMKQLFDFLNMGLEQSEKRKRSYEREMPPPKEEVMEMGVPIPESKDAPKIVSDTEIKVELMEIKQEGNEAPPPPPPPPPPPAKKKTTSVPKKKN